MSRQIQSPHKIGPRTIFVRQIQSPQMRMALAAWMQTAEEEVDKIVRPFWWKISAVEYFQKST